IEALKDNPTPSSKILTKSSSTSSKSFLEETNTFHNSLPKFENFCLDLEEVSSGSTTTDSDISLSDYEFFYFHDDQIEEISSGSTTTHSDISLSEYDSPKFYMIALHPRCLGIHVKSSKPRPSSSEFFKGLKPNSNLKPNFTTHQTRTVMKALTRNLSMSPPQGVMQGKDTKSS
nr:hypothetical protein [Tanacetum cinerariifolium]